MWLPVILICFGGSLAANVETYYEWKYVDYVWESAAAKQSAIDSGLYNYTHIFADDVQLTRDGRTFVTTPRIRLPNPASLSVVSSESGEGGPLLAPYPNWEWHTPNNCSTMVNVIRVYVDPCDRLWVVDCGKTLSKQICPPKILAFDLRTNELLHKVEIPIELSWNPTDNTKGLLELQTVRSVGASCEETELFITDIYGFGLLIWDGEDVWRIDDEIFTPDPAHVTFDIAGGIFTLRLGIAGAVITPPGFLDDEYLLLRPVSSVTAYAASISELLNTKYGGNVTYYKATYNSTTQQLARALSSTGIYASEYGTATQLACTNLQGSSPYADTILDDSVEKYQFVTAIKFLEPTCGQGEPQLRLLSNRLQKVYLGTMDYNDVNFRVLGTDDVAGLVSGTDCEPKDHDVQSIEDKSFAFYKTSTYPASISATNAR